MPYTAIVGALRRLATDAVVMNANVTHVMYVGLTTAALAAGTLTGRPAGTSIDAMRSLPTRGLSPRSYVEVARRRDGAGRFTQVIANGPCERRHARARRSVWR